MVSSLLIDALNNPTDVLKSLYDSSTSDNFAQKLTKHFTDVFNTDSAWNLIPIMDSDHAPECFKNRSLVRFRAMVQDTSGNPEMYLSELPNAQPGGWGLETTADDDTHPIPNIDYTKLKECQVMWCVSVPGESQWRSHELNGDIDESQPAGSLSNNLFPHKHPLQNTRHVGAQVKIYDSAISEVIRATDCYTFVGILTREPLALSRSSPLSLSEDHDSMACDSDAHEELEVPTLHVLFNRVVPTAITTHAYPLANAEDIRNELLDWIAEESLGGDRQAAEWLLLGLIGKVQSRHPPLYPPSILLSEFPLPPAPVSPSQSDGTTSAAVGTTKTLTAQLLPTLAHLIPLVTPQSATIPLTIDLLNKVHFAPSSENEDLHAGLLQLAPGTTVLLSECGIAEGTINSRGLTNIRTCQEVISTQTLNYQFPYSSFAFPTDMGCVVVAPGKRSAFFKTNFNMPLKAKALNNLYKPANEINVPSEEKLVQFRNLILGSRSARISVNDATSEHIQEDFVRERQQSKTNAEEMMSRMTVAKLLAQSTHASEVTMEHWESAKKMCAQSR